MSRDFDDRSRRLARERYWEEHSKEKYTCPDCDRGQSDIIGEFQVHHKSGNPHDNRLEHLIALCGFCHRLREGKKPSLERIKQFREADNVGDSGKEEQTSRGRPGIYTAGRMVWHNDEDSSYRASVQSRSDINADLIHPQDTYFDHGGDIVSGCVAEDIEKVDRADGLVALFDEVGQTGTMVETMHAIGNGTPVLVLLSSDIVQPPLGPAPTAGRRGRPVKFPRPVNHPAGMRMSSQLWFLINYLNGDYTAARARPGPEIDWGGVDSTVAIVAKGDGSIGRALRSWVDSGLTSIDFGDSSGGGEVKREAKEVADPRWADE